MKTDLNLFRRYRKAIGMWIDEDVRNIFGEDDLDALHHGEAMPDPDATVGTLEHVATTPWPDPPPQQGRRIWRRQIGAPRHWCTWMRGEYAKAANTAASDTQEIAIDDEDTPYREPSGMRWAALIKRVYEADPLSSNPEGNGGDLVVRYPILPIFLCRTPRRYPNTLHPKSLAARSRPR